jgi:hypothetical protein
MASLNEITGNLSRAQAAHLLRRSTFGPTFNEIDTFTGLSASAAMTQLLDDSAPDPLPPIDPATGATWVDPPPHPMLWMATVNRTICSAFSRPGTWM